MVDKIQEVRDFIETNHRKPSRHDPEERYKYINWLKQQRKLLNVGALKKVRIEPFKELMRIWEENKRVNQYV